jgi:hypothetical protein
MSTSSAPRPGANSSRAAAFRREAGRLARERSLWRALTFATAVGLTIVGALVHVGALVAWGHVPQQWRIASRVIATAGLVGGYLAGRRWEACTRARTALADRWMADVLALAGGAPLPEGWERDELAVLVDADEDRARLLEAMEWTPAGPGKLRDALAAIGADE